MTEDDKRLIFLLGAGISIPAGMPSTGQITERVMSGENVFKHTDEAFYLGTKPSLLEQNTEVGIALEVISILHSILIEYYSYYPGKTINYEDIYALAYAVYRAHWNSPELQSLLDKIMPKLEAIIKGKRKEDLSIKRWNSTRVCRNTVNYIRDIVWHLLSVEPTQVDYLNILRDAYNDAVYSSFDIFSLNNDTVIENFLDSEGIDYIDGFGREENGIRYWYPQLYSYDSIKTKIYKLHGSVNWFRFMRRASQLQTEKIGIPTKPDIYRMKDASGIHLWPTDGRPLILVGTDNKILSYSSGMYLRLISTFQKHLDEVNRLVVSGYSFGDMGINRLIFDWVDAVNSRRLLLISRDDSWLKKQGQHIRSRVIFANKLFEEINYSEVKSFLGG